MRDEDGARRPRSLLAHGVASGRPGRGGPAGDLHRGAPGQGGDGCDAEQDRPQRRPRDRANHAHRLVSRGPCEESVLPVLARVADGASHGAQQAPRRGEWRASAAARGGAESRHAQPPRLPGPRARTGSRRPGAGQPGGIAAERHRRYDPRGRETDQARARRGEARADMPPTDDGPRRRRSSFIMPTIVRAKRVSATRFIPVAVKASLWWGVTAMVTKLL